MKEIKETDPDRNSTQILERELQTIKEGGKVEKRCSFVDVIIDREKIPEEVIHKLLEGEELGITLQTKYTNGYREEVLTDIYPPCERWKAFGEHQWKYKLEDKGSKIIRYCGWCNNKELEQAKEINIDWDND